MTGTGIDQGPQAGAAAEPAFAAFAAELARLVPGLPADLRPQTRVAELLAGDRIVKGLVAAALQRLLHDPPDGIVVPDATLGELVEWAEVRRSSLDLPPAVAPAAAPPAPDLPPGHSVADDLRVMRTAHVRLRPLVNDDYPELYASALDPRWSYRWRYRGATPSTQEFIATLHQGILSQFIIERLSDRRAVGLVNCYNARTDLGWAYLAFTRVSSPRSVGGSEMLEGGYLFTSFVFRQWNFRKLYAEI